MIQSIVKLSQIEDRLDAEFYHPAKLAALRRIGQHQTKIGDFFRSYKKLEVPCGNQIINLVELNDVADFAIANIKRVEAYKSGSAKKHFVNNDVLISRLRSYLKQIVFVESDELSDEQRNLASTEFVVLRNRNKGISSEFLFSYLQIEEIQTILTWSQEGSNHPRFSENYLMSLPIPVKNVIAQRVSSLVRNSLSKRDLAQQKYAEAKRLVNDFLKIENQNFSFHNTFFLPYSKIGDRFDSEYYQPLELLNLPIFERGSAPLGEIASIHAGKTPAKHAYTKRGIRMLKVRDLTNQGVDWEEGNRAYIVPEVWEKTKKARVEENDLLLISAAHQAYYIGQEVDVVFDIPKEFGRKLLAVAELLIIRAGKINPFVLLWYLRTRPAYLLIQRLITGETSHLYAKDLATLPIPKALLDFSREKEVEKLTKDAMSLRRESKELLEEAKRAVEEMIEKGKND